ncbi:hypothetical protein CDL15_Pgr027788 [Punica granatum]|uniref:Uncharacterized protein n=1 Tax=Punica granatum TaxID=22663 RepID=A0A218XKL1_PUNGR|nr:hypothetical protein CDL15_Pgr027788 [Punica granatum]
MGRWGLGIEPFLVATNCLRGRDCYRSGEGELPPYTPYQNEEEDDEGLYDLRGQPRLPSSPQIRGW